MIISRIVDRLSKHKYHMTTNEKLEEANRLIEIVEKARAMSDTEFEIEKQTLAEEIKPEDIMAELRKEIELRKPNHGRPRISRSVRFLLNDRIIPILEERLENRMVSMNQ